MDLKKLNEMKPREMMPGAKARFVHSEKMTLAFWELAVGAEVPEHSHPHEQVVNVIEGELKLTVVGEAKTLTPGTLAVLPPHTVHAAKAITPCRVLDIFCPVREDFR